MAVILRTQGKRFLHRYRWSFDIQQVKAFRAIQNCRTAALAGHLDACPQCGYRVISYNSCRNRNCPKCQAHARDRWLQARRRELLPTPYVHVVFTLPPRLAPLALQNKKVIYDLLFRTCAETLLEIARDPRHLGAEIGFFSVLHTWNQKLEHHPHVHCVIPAGGLSPDHRRWIHPRYRLFLPVKVLRRVFRGKFVAALKRAFADGQLGFYGDLNLLAKAKAFSSFLRPLFRHDGVVYCKPPFGGPQHVLHYLGRYTHRVAISNHRLVSWQASQVTFRWRDSAHGNQQRLITLSVEEFLRRFLLHLLPPGFVRIRHFGFVAHRRRAASLPLCFQFLEPSTDSWATQESQRGDDEGQPPTPPSISPWSCPQCGGPMIILERLTVAEMCLRSPPLFIARVS